MSSEASCSATPSAGSAVSSTTRRFAWKSLVIVSGSPGLVDAHLEKALDKAHRAG